MRRVLVTGANKGIGLAIAVAVAVTPLLFGDALLESAVVKLHPPLIGEVKLVSSALFDLGVMVLVTGVVLAALAAFVREADDPTPPAAVDPTRPAPAVTGGPVPEVTPR